MHPTRFHSYKHVRAFLLQFSDKCMYEMENVLYVKICSQTTKENNDYDKIHTHAYIHAIGIRNRAWYDYVHILHDVVPRAVHSKC